MERPRILIIDDDPNLRKTLSDILRAKGYETLAAGNGGEGLALLGKNSFNLVLIDLGLPDISGLEVLERAKADSPATEAIILTGQATLDSAVEATNRGAFSYLQKPYDIEQLMLHIRRAIEKEEAEAKIVRHSNELRRTNEELKALYEVSLAISRTIDLDRLLAEVLHALAEMKIVSFKWKGAIFLVEGGGLRLVSSIDLHEKILARCKSLRLGECLCGLAAATGEIIISKDSREDKKHTVSIPEIPSHGHIIVPLKAADKVVGVLNIYTRADMELDERLLNLLISIGNQVGIAVENARLYEEAKSFSLHDSLTGLANRRFLQVQMEKSFEAAKRYGEKLSVVMLDIDHFKRYNDTYGHVEGDRLLVRIADILLREIRSADHAFRYGGEEFLCMLPKTDLTMACEAAERLRRAVESEVGVTISLGVASYRETMADKDVLVNMADEALYRAKRKGRNRVEAGIARDMPSV